MNVKDSTINFNLNQPRDVVVIGRSGVDLYPNEFNPTENVQTYSKYVGGSPANEAVQMAKLELDVAFIGKVSQDPLGQYVKSYLKSVGVDTSYMLNVDSSSIRHSLAIAEQPTRGEMEYLFYRDRPADIFLSINDIDEKFIKNFKFLLISGASLSQSPVREAVMLAIEYAKRNQVKIVFDPDYRKSNWNSITEASLYYAMVARKSDIIFGTREELNVVEYIYNKDNTDDLKTAESLFDFNPSIVCIKHGEQGSVLYNKNGESIKHGICPARVHKTLGAGDSFLGAFLAAILRKNTIQEALLQASAAAAITISGRACSQSMPTLSMLNSYLQAYSSNNIDEWPGWSQIV